MLFGVIALLIVGASWCLCGIILGMAPKKGLDTSAIQLASAFVSIIVSLIIYQLVPHSNCPMHILLATCGMYMLSGIFNYNGLQAMSRGMQRGPNGIVWCIMQSALIFSFLGGVVFFGEELTPFRGFGIVLLFAALILFGLAKDNTQSISGGSWRFWAFLALVLMSIQQNICNAPSFFPASREVHPILRSMASAFGTITASIVGISFRLAREKDFAKQLRQNFRKPLMWIFVAMPLFFSLIFAYTLHYPGMDAMAKAGAGSVNYPLMVGSCIISFSLYSKLVLHEEMKPKQIVAMTLCIMGLACLCVPAHISVQRAIDTITKVVNP